MAEEQSQERTEAATPKKREDARKKGQVPRSRELSTSALLLLSASLLYGLGSEIQTMATDFLRAGLRLTPAVMSNHQDLLRHLVQMAGLALSDVLPLWLALMLVVVLASIALGGWNFSTKTLIPNFSHLDPIEGIQRLFSRRGFLELVKAALKTLVVGGIGVTVIWAQRGELLGLIQISPKSAMVSLLSMSGLVFLIMGVGTLLIVLFDVPFQLWSFNEKLKMSRQDIKDEMKEMDGNPQIKTKVRSMQREMARRRMMAAIPSASVVVTNPTHYAVALRYVESENRAPVVLAKGAGNVALRIRELAQEHGVPLVEAPPLARALYHHVELEQEIPALLYRAVAEVLAYLHQLRLAPPGQALELPEQWSVPPELDQGG
ncbi:flagellar biosynthesis protein FlhB [Acidithiobacillus caldus]|uniref:Flagellar biosynthetic protein FlhB n=1 Tax=Acidithiobacillus caldus TaxID=33059 RepID=A0A1E7YP17_9PROT|nr:flagellar biosynthesis protein FlhB [Acidithiobacillus caldus]OFC37068.1 flagellar biosynthesis protein FlhB [Acidithiobacillus caldus]OFC37105.1 flagellar biosynthesis protein FlhB [Acidithiobacillus caldus]OFC38834.1 flagellar biosynthesis protein FlhB [Acidithiobacillus caldus]